MRLEIVFRNVADAVEPPKRGHKAARAYERTEAARLIAEAAKTRCDRPSAKANVVQDD